RSISHLFIRGDKTISKTERLIRDWNPWINWTNRYVLYWTLELLWPLLLDSDEDRLGHRLTLYKYVQHPKERFLSSLKSKEKRDKVIKYTDVPFKVGCKRAMFSDDWYPTIAMDHVHVITDPIEKFTKGGIKHQGSQEEIPLGIFFFFFSYSRNINNIHCIHIHTYKFMLYLKDGIILATGFHSNLFLSSVDIFGKNGVNLKEMWRGDDPRAYYGIVTHGFPNLFIVYGPNTNIGHHSVIFMAECQVDYIINCIEKLIMEGPHIKSMDVKLKVQDQFNEHLHAQLRQSVWNTGCSSWYKNEAGNIVNNCLGVLRHIGGKQEL
ncbi:alpha/beta hydrolase fold-3 domain protein, partial [Reticulomyxa filosa]